jgi:tetratricopeptide (TPR) repeat protein
MIVKNEEANLADCLQAVGDFPAEIIVVDTGSTDRTMDIARRFGARVEHFAWIDDFAAARNESLKYATGEWILWLDADDRILPGELNRLKHAAASNAADGYLCRMVSPLADGPNPAVNRVYYNLLFRRRPGVRFEGPIHETVTEAMLRQGLTVAYTNITLTHTGYQGDPAALRRKAQRNVRILRQCTARESDTMKWRYHLGVSLYQLGDFAGAIAQLETVVNHPAPGLNVHSHLYKAYMLLLSAHTTTPNLEKVEATLQRALALFPQRRHGWITAGMLYLRQNRPAAAVAALEKARSLPPESDAEGEAWGPGVLEEHLAAAYHAVGGLAFQQQNYPQAAAAFAALLELAPPARRPEVCKLLALALKKNGQEQEALACWQLAQELGS